MENSTILMILMGAALIGLAAIWLELRVQGQFRSMPLPTAVPEFSDDDPLIDVLHHALANRTGKLRVSDAYLICGIEPGKVNQAQIARFGRAIRELGWERARRRFDGSLYGSLQYAYVRGTAAEREVELVVTYDPHMRSARIEIDKSARTPMTTHADNLTEAELNAFEYHGCSSGTSTPQLVRDAIVRATAEIRRHRADRGALEAAIERMAPIVAAAERWVDNGPVNAGIKAAVEGYRAKIQGRLGAPGLRDPEHPSADYDPTPGGPRICEGDGHYLCKNCKHRTELSAAQQEEPETPSSKNSHRAQPIT